MKYYITIENQHTPESHRLTIDSTVAEILKNIANKRDMIKDCEESILKDEEQLRKLFHF